MCFHVFVPVPFAYAQLLKILLFTYCMWIPIGVVGTFGWFTAFVSYFNALVVFSVDYVGCLIECPFGNDERWDVDMDASLNDLLMDMALVIDDPNWSERVTHIRVPRPDRLHVCLHHSLYSLLPYTRYRKMTMMILIPCMERFSNQGWVRVRMMILTPCMGRFSYVATRLLIT